MDSRDTLLRETRETVARIEAKLDNALADIGDHEGRLRSIESKWWQFPVTGIIAALSALHGHNL